VTGDTLIRTTATLAVLVVAGIAAAISFGHIESVALANGQPLVAARALPVSIDGAIVASSMVLLDAARRGTEAPVLARVMLGAGVAATLAANAISGAGHGPVGIGVAVLPAAAFIGSVEVLLAMIRQRSSTPVAVIESAPADIPEAVPQATPSRTRPAPTSLSDSGSRRRGVHRAPEVVFAAELTAGAVPSVRAVKRHMRVGQDRAVQIRKDLAAMIAVSATRETIEATA
jgi:hypothetical protein